MVQDMAQEVNAVVSLFLPIMEKMKFMANVNPLIMDNFFAMLINLQALAKTILKNSMYCVSAIAVANPQAMQWHMDLERNDLPLVAMIQNLSLVCLKLITSKKTSR